MEPARQLISLSARAVKAPRLKCCLLMMENVSKENSARLEPSWIKAKIAKNVKMDALSVRISQDFAPNASQTL